MEQVGYNHISACPTSPTSSLPTAKAAKSSKKMLPPFFSADTIQNSRQKLKKTKKKEAEAKRAQSIDWTGQGELAVGDSWTNSQFNDATTASAGDQNRQVNFVAHHANSYSNSGEEYYSVPRKCHRVSSSGYLSLQPTTSDAGDRFSVPQPPSSPPPTPPFSANKIIAWSNFSWVIVSTSLETLKETLKALFQKLRNTSNNNSRPLAVIIYLHYVLQTDLYVFGISNFCHS